VGIAIKNANGTFVAPIDLPVINLKTISSQTASVVTQSGVKLVTLDPTATGPLFRYSLGLSFYLDQVVSSNSTSSLLVVVRDSLAKSECLFL